MKKSSKSKIRKNFLLLLFYITLKLPLSVLSSRKQAKLFPQTCVFTVSYILLHHSSYHTLLSFMVSLSMSPLGIICNQWWCSAWQIVETPWVLFKKKRRWMKSVTVGILYIISGPIYKPACIILNSSKYIPLPMYFFSN